MKKGICIHRHIRKSSKKAGLPPGTPVYVGKTRDKQIKITCIEYNEQTLEENPLDSSSLCFPNQKPGFVTWINVDGVYDADLVQKIGEQFGIHPLVLEDIMNTGQRPKTEDFEKYLYIILKMLHFDENLNETKTEQVSLVLGPNYLISFQETEGDVFDPIRERLKNNRGKIRKKGADYLGYSLIDAVVDNYYITLEKIGEKLEDIEEDLVKNPTPELLHSIHRLKRELIFLRKSVWPLREVISKLDRWESPLINKSIEIYLRDVYDHTIQVIDTVETFRDMLSGMLDIYLSSISNRMNEVMKVLTIITTIFIPLSLIAGIYGMNFTFMPELEIPFAYPLVLLSMLTLSTIMVIYFKKRKWI